MNSQRFAVIHIGKSHRQAHKPKLAKEYACPGARTEKAANLKTDRIEHKNRQCTTGYIRHAGDTAYLYVCNSIKLFCNLTGLYLEIPHRRI